MIDLAPRYGITHIEFSHHMVWYADELLVDRYRGGDVNRLAARWRYFNEAFFGYKAFFEHPDPVMRARVMRSLDALDRWADIQEREFGEDIVVGKPESIRSFVKDVSGRLPPNPFME